MTGRDHRIAVGDHVVRLAYRALHPTVDAVWGASANAELRKQRADPGVLAEGDVVHVPEAAPRRFRGLLTRREHELVVELPEARLRLALIRPSGVPYASTRTRARFDEGERELEPDADGMVELEIGPDTSHVDLEYDDQRIRLEVAHLQPVDVAAGWHARLENLGYAPGRLDGDQADQHRLRSAVEEFQCDYGLTVDGVVGEKTQTKLVEVHGA